MCLKCMLFFFFKQKTAYEMRISDWSSDVCSSDLLVKAREPMFEDDRIFGPRKIAVRPADIPRHRRRGGQRGGEQRPRFQERAGKRLHSPSPDCLSLWKIGRAHV